MCQGVLRLDQPYKKPSASHISFNLCQQYQHCSCCNASHTVAIQRALQVSEAEPLSDDCYAVTAQLACRPCDPEVGMGQKDRICSRTCQKWFDRCRLDFFSYNVLSQSLEVCGTKAASAVCSQANQLASNGYEFCTLAGLQVLHKDDNEANTDCFDGSKPPVYDSCLQQTKRTSTQAQTTGSPVAVPNLQLFWVLAAGATLILLYRQVKHVGRRLSAHRAVDSSTAPAKSGNSQYFRGQGRRLRD